MHVMFTARHFTASQSLQDFAEEQVQKLTKFYDGIKDCDIIAEPHEDPENPQKVEIKLNVPGKLLAATESAESYEAAIHKSVDILSRQLRKYKEKQQSH